MMMMKYRTKYYVSNLPLVLDDRDQEDTSAPDLVTTPREEEDQVDKAEDNVILEDQVSRKLLAPHYQEPVSTVVPETSTSSKVQTDGKTMFISLHLGGNSSVQRCQGDQSLGA